MQYIFDVFYFVITFFIIYCLIFAFSCFTKSSCTSQPAQCAPHFITDISASLKISDPSFAPPQHWLRVSVALRHGEAAFSCVGNSAPAAFPACRPSVPVSLEVIYLTLWGSLRSHKKGLYATFSPLAYAVVLRKASKQPLRCHTGGTPFPRTAWQQRA